MFDGVRYLLKECWKYNKSYVICLFLKQIIVIASSLIAIILPQYILDQIFNYNNYHMSLLYVAIFITSSLLCSLSLNYLISKIMIERTIIYKYFQLYLSKKIMNVKYEDLESSSFLDLKSKADKFLYGGGNGFASVLEVSFDILGKCLTMIVIVKIIAELNFYLVIFLLIIVLFNSYISAKNQKFNIEINLSKSKHERRSQYFSNIFNDFAYGKEIRVFNLCDWLLGKYEVQLNTMQTFYNRLGKKNCFYGGIVILTSTIQQLIAYAYLLKESFSGFVTVGQFSKYLMSISTFSTTLKDIISSIINMQQYTNYYESYKQYISTSEICENSEEGILNNIDEKITIEFEHVYFKYKNQKNYALEDISIKLNFTDKIAIVGENGAGKTTLIKLLLRIYKPTEGIIKLNGIDINSLDFKQYISMFSSVFQDYKLFSLPVIDNLVLSNNIESDDLHNVLTKLGLLDKINNLKKGFDTFIYKDFDSNGFTPSGGESQKVAMARAALKNSRIVILDEPTSSLDPKAESELYENFDSLFKNRMCIYITHRLASTKFCNSIIVVKDGKIVEFGNHADLMVRNGEYNKLFNLQAKFYN